MIAFLCSIYSFSQIEASRKSLKAVRIEKAPKIDGSLNEIIWQNVPVAKDFIMMRPDNGKAEPQNQKTEVKVLYDNNAIYIGAYMYDENPTKIPREFSVRDNVANADFFLITINPNDDGQNPFEFAVQSSGVQFDAKISNGNEDGSWNAVWESGVKITDKGWVAEIKIPYRALRFANTPIQTWGINFHRRVQNNNAQYTWTHIDNKKGMWTQYDGILEGLKNIKPPTRLSFYPYASGTTNTFKGNTTFEESFGMDLKYGITENFTLDATLIPDFSQTGFDNITLNLGPFEQQFNEQRQFFTEGTELFNKGRLFYSRRIGSTPVGFSTLAKSLEDNEEIIDNPDNVTMLNAIKVSGRTKSGLGIGFFNAITEKTEATIKRTVTNPDNTTTEEVYKKVTEPFTNYNVTVLDQQFNKNSAVTLINTNVLREGSFRDANATGLLYHVETKNSKYFIDGSAKMSNVYENSNRTTGYTFDTSIGKGFGNWRGEVGYSFEDEKYDPNDLGILFANNEQSIYSNISYRILKPSKILNGFRITGNANVNYLKKPSVYTGTRINLNVWTHSFKQNYFGGNINYNSSEKDFFEPRQGSMSGIYFKRPESINFNHWGETDRRKKLRLNYFITHTSFTKDPKKRYGFELEPKFRFTDRFSLNYGLSYFKTNADRGYVDKINDAIILGQRDRKFISNTLSGKYSFGINSSLSLTFRHNWEAVNYTSEYFNLNLNGNLTNYNYEGTDNINFNSWNLDLNYIWQFAPGSQLIAFYRNTITNFDDNASLNFTENIDSLFNQPVRHIFSLRLVYFIDYNNLKNIF